MREYTLYLTFKCNWKCSYCITDTHNQIEPSSIIDKIKDIENDSFVSISGGEPGLASEETVRLTFELLTKKNCKIHLNTNGTFLKTFPQYLDYVNTISYHCFADEVNPFFRRFPELEYKMDYVITVTDQMMCDLETFFKINQDIKFYVFSADMIIKSDGSVNNFLSKKNILKLYSKYKEYLNPECYSKLFGKCITSDTQLK